MTLKRFKGNPGTIVVLEHDSKILAGNPLGDPHVRKLARLAAAAVRRGQRARPRPALPGALRPRRLHRLGPRARRTGSRSARTCPSAPRGSIHERKMGPAIIVFPDCFTALGGNQYVNSSAIGDYADYLTREIMPFVDREFRTLASREHRGCFGKSSGGYGAIIHGMRYAQYWGAVADHSGDALLRFRLLARLAEHAERARQVPPRPSAAPGRVDALREASARAWPTGFDDGRVQALPRARLEEGQARRRRRSRAS